MVVTAALLARAKLCGACGDLPAVGASLEDLTQGQLRFAAERDLLACEEISAVVGRSDIPLELLAGSGSGSGDGDGYGYGYGSGDGDGDGYGYGSGYGYGYGDGSGDGYGSGSGYGDGDGDGYGDGYGGSAGAPASS
jgi:hypothetical protein